MGTGTFGGYYLNNLLVNTVRSVLLLTLIVSCAGCDDSWLKWKSGSSGSGSVAGGPTNPNDGRQIPSNQPVMAGPVTASGGKVWHDPSELTPDSRRVAGVKDKNGPQGGEWIEVPGATPVGQPTTPTQPNGLQGGRVPDDSVVIGEGTPAPEALLPRKTYTVQKGDTLYSIYRKTNVHPHKLIDWNNLPKGNVIYVGQTVYLEPPRAGQQVAIKATPDAQLGFGKSVYQTEDDLPAGESVNKETTIQQPQIAKTNTDTDTASEPVNVPTTESNWVWPLGARGETRVTSPRLGHKGIIINAEPNETVRAVASGAVVYVGSGQGALGKIIIVRHDGDVLTLYGNNSKALVKNKQVIKQGEPIATVGEYRAGKTGLYFEVRVDSVTVDPLSKLP